jgi:putative peptide zinc metalloprotease protein
VAAPPLTGARRRRALLAASPAGQAATAIAARHGAAGERPALRPELVVRRHVQMGEVRWFVKNPGPLKYYIFYEHEWRLIDLFDGSRTRAEIARDYNARYSFDPIDVAVVLDYEEMLRKLDLVAQSAAERNLALLQKMKSARRRAADEKAEGGNPFFLLFHVLDPERFLNRTVRYVRWVWTPPVVAGWSVAVAWTVAVFVLNWRPIYTGTYELYAFLRKPLLDAIEFFLLLSVVGFFHEFGHAYATKIYGGEVRDIGIALLYFTPAFYCDTTDALLFPNKWHRLWVTTAGIYVEGFICAAATALWVASYPDTLLHDVAYKAMLFTGVSTVFFNVNPLIKIDGYHALTSVLEMPDLREDSFQHIGLVFQKRVLRLPVDVPPASRRRRRIYWTYGTLALGYLGVIMAFIAGIFFNLYNRLVPDFALAFLAVTLYWVFQKRVRLVVRTARLLYLDKKEYLMSKKARPALLTGAALLLLVGLVPWTHRTIAAEAVLRPASVARIEAPEEGVVVSVAAGESDPVAAGGELFRLVSAEADAEAARTAGESERHRRAASSAREAAAAEKVFAIEQLLSSSEAAGQSVAARRRRLSLRSPIAGRVLTPRVQDLEHRFVAARTLLAEVGDCRTLVAELPISERYLEDVWVGASVRAFVGERPLEPLRGTVIRISAATLDQPRTATSRLEPTAPSQTPDRFVVLAAFDNADGALLPGTIVRAKIDSHRASLASRAARVLTRWARTVVW